MKVSPTVRKVAGTFLIDVVLAVLVISVLFVVRDQTRAYIRDVQAYAPELVKLQQEFASQNLSVYEYGQATATIDSVDRLLTKGLFLMKIALPLVLFVLFVAAGFLTWRVVARVAFFHFFVYFLPLAVLAWLVIVQGFAFLSVFLVGEGAFRGWLFVLSLAVLCCYGYFFMVSMLVQKSVRENIAAALMRGKRLIGWYSLFLMLFAASAALAVLIFIFSWVRTNILVPSIVLVVVLLGLALVRAKLANKYERRL